LFSPKKDANYDVLKLDFDERRETIRQKFTQKHEKIKSDNEKKEKEKYTYKPEGRIASVPNYKKNPLKESKELKNFLDRQKQAMAKKSNEKCLIDPSIRIKQDINDVYDKLFHKTRKDKPLTERVSSPEKLNKANSAKKNNTLNTPKKNPKEKNKTPVKITASPVKKSPNIDIEKNMIRSQLHAIQSISLV